MKIGFIIQNDYPHLGEVRVRRLSKSLHQSGHSVCFLCWNSRKRPQSEVLEHGRVFRFNLMLNSPLFGLISAPSPLNIFWVWWISFVVKKENLQTLVVSNLRIALPALLAGKLLGIPVVLDLQENNAELVRYKPKTKWGHIFSRNAMIVGLLERLCIKCADKVWIVVEERLESLPRSLRTSGKIKVVHHTVPLDEIELYPASFPKRGADFVLIFIGRVDGRSGVLDMIFKALSYAAKKDPQIRLKIGGVEAHPESLSKRLEEFQVREFVDIEGRIEPENLQAWLGQGHLGLICYPVNSFTNTTISNKLFHYMAAGLPVLSTDMKPTRRIIEENKCGVLIPPESPASSIAGIILDLKNNPGEFARMGEKALRAVREKYNWEKDFRIVLDSLNELSLKMF